MSDAPFTVSRGRGGPTGRTVAAALVGAVVGLVLGLAVEAGIWIWAFANALDGGKAIDVPLVVRITSSGGDVAAQSGAGVLVIPFAALLVGMLVGLATGRVRRASR